MDQLIESYWQLLQTIGYHWILFEERLPTEDETRSFGSIKSGSPCWMAPNLAKVDCPQRRRGILQGVDKRGILQEGMHNSPVLRDGEGMEKTWLTLRCLGMEPMELMSASTGSQVHNPCEVIKD